MTAKLKIGEAEKEWTTEERVARLEAYRKQDRERIDATATALQEFKRETEGALAKVQQDQSKEVHKQSEFLRELATGGLAAQWMGWGWLVIGMMLSTLSQEAAWVLQRLGSS